MCGSIMVAFVCIRSGSARMCMTAYRGPLSAGKGNVLGRMGAGGRREVERWDAMRGEIDVGSGI